MVVVVRTSQETRLRSSCVRRNTRFSSIAFRAFLLASGSEDAPRSPSKLETSWVMSSRSSSGDVSSIIEIFVLSTLLVPSMGTFVVFDNSMVRMGMKCLGKAKFQIMRRISRGRPGKRWKVRDAVDGVVVDEAVAGPFREYEEPGNRFEEELRISNIDSPSWRGGPDSVLGAIIVCVP